MPTPDPVNLSAVASDSTGTLADQLITAYQVEHPHVAIRLTRTANSATAIQQLALGQTDVAIIAEGPEREDGVPLLNQEIARDAIAVIVHPENALAALDVDQVRGIFTGKIRDWTSLDASASGKIEVITREPGSHTRWLFQASALRNESIVPIAKILTDSISMVDHIARSPTAIGYVSASLLDPRVKSLFIDGAPADARLGSAAGYPLLQSIFIVTRHDVTQQGNDFVAFVLGAEGQDIVGQSHGRIR